MARIGPGTDLLMDTLRYEIQSILVEVILVSSLGNMKIQVRVIKFLLFSSIVVALMCFLSFRFVQQRAVKGKSKLLKKRA